MGEMDQKLAVINTPVRLMGKAVNEMLAAVSAIQKSSIAELTLDLSQTEFIDSSGIGSLVSLTKEFKGTGITFTLRNLKNDIKELFAETGLDVIFNIESERGVDKARVDIFDTGVDIRLEISQEIDGEICVFHLSGVMNHPMGSRFFKQQFLLAMAQFKKILLDFENLTFFDSLSVSVILNMNRLLKETGGSMRMCGANFIVADLFSTLNINQIIPIFDDIPLAKADWV